MVAVKEVGVPGAFDVTTTEFEFADCDPTPLFHVTSARIEYPTDEYATNGESIVYVVPPFCIIDPPVNEFPPVPPSFLLQIIVRPSAAGLALGVPRLRVSVLPTDEDPEIDAVPPEGAENV